MISQHPPLKNALLVIVGIIVALSIAAIFLLTFGRAQGDIRLTGVNMTAAQCQGKCQAVIGQGFNYNTCAELMQNKDASAYNQSCTDNCRIVIKNAIVCDIN